jgi:hypothetical protein
MSESPGVDDDMPVTVSSSGDSTATLGPFRQQEHQAQRRAMETIARARATGLARRVRPYCRSRLLQLPSRDVPSWGRCVHAQACLVKLGDAVERLRSVCRQLFTGGHVLNTGDPDAVRWGSARGFPLVWDGTPCDVMQRHTLVM